MPSAPAGWAHRLALVTAAATLLLIVAGGLVTNTGAALAVPDWPTTFGHNMFLYPWSGMVGGVFYEHGHRLLGALVGALTLALAAALWRGKRRWLRWLGLAAVGLVCLQGLLGGLRVLLVQDTLAIVHGCLAQAFFVLAAALALFTSPGWEVGGDAPGRPDTPRRLLWLGIAASAALYLQVVLGALTTHAGRVGLHLGGAVLATALTGALAARLLARPARALAGPARLLAGLLVAQLLLGLGAYLARFTGLALPGGAVAGLALPVAHRAVASLLLAAAVTITLTLWRGWPGRESPAPTVVPVPRLSRGAAA